MNRGGTDHGKHLRTCVVVLSLACVSACGSSANDAANAVIQPKYDKATGKLAELTFDSNANGRMDTWTDMDGTRPLRSRVDTNEDGKIDRWEEYDAGGALARVGFSRGDTGKPDAWAYAGPDGTVQRIEISLRGDGQIDRREYYEASRSGGDGHGALVRAEEDTTRSGRPDRWETYENGALKTVAFDENGNGRPDRRITYSSSGHMVIESQPDAAGRFASRVQSKN